MSTDGKGGVKWGGQLALAALGFGLIVWLADVAPVMLPPLAVLVAVFVLFTRTRFGPRHFKAAVAVAGCHFAGYGASVLIAASSEETQRLVGWLLPDLVVLGILLAWLVLRPGGVAALLVGAYEVVGIIVNFAVFSKLGTGPNARLGHLWLWGHLAVRLLTIASLWKGYEAWYTAPAPGAPLARKPLAKAPRSRSAPSATVPSAEAPAPPDIELKPLVAPSVPAPERSGATSPSAPAKVSFNLRSPAVVAVIVIAVAAAIGAAAVELRKPSLTSECGEPSSSAYAGCIQSLALRTGDANLCGRLAADRSESCILEVATDVTGDAADCQRLQNAEKRAECAVMLVRQGRPAKLCALAQGTASASACATGAGERGGPRACEELPIEMRELCLEASAPPIADPEPACGHGPGLCLPLLGATELQRCAARDDNEQVWCFSGQLGKGGGWSRDSFCESVAEGLPRDRCFKALGQRPDHGTTCTKIQNLDLRRSCIAFAAQQDATYCRLLDGEAERRSCLIDSGLTTLDAEICGWVEGEQRQACLENSQRRARTELARIGR